jgi:hypothetical protein
MKKAIKAIKRLGHELIKTYRAKPIAENGSFVLQVYPIWTVERRKTSQR